MQPQVKKKHKGLEDDYDPDKDKLKIRYALIQTQQDVRQEIADMFKLDNIDDYISKIESSK